MSGRAKTILYKQIERAQTDMQIHSKYTLTASFVLSHIGIYTILSHKQNKMAIINKYPHAQTTYPTTNEVISLTSTFNTHICSFSNILQNKKPLNTTVFISNFFCRLMKNESEFFHRCYFMKAKLSNYVIFT